MTALSLWTRRRPHLAISMGVVCLLALVFALNIIVSEVSPSSVWGMSYGAGATVLLVSTAAYAARRRAPRRGPGRAHVWLLAHVYGGGGFFVLMLMHTGFDLPRSPLGWSLWLISVYVCLSGVVGLLLQRWLPRVLSSAFVNEVNYDRIPELIAVVRTRAEELMLTCDETVQRSYERDLAPAFAGPRPRLRYFLDATGGIHARIGELDHLRSLLTAADAPKLDALKQLVVTKLEFDAQYTLQRALRLWLLGHVPLTLALLVLVGFHLFSIWYY